MRQFVALVQLMAIALLAIESVALAQPRGFGSDDLESRFARYDANKDGVITEQEIRDSGSRFGEAFIPYIQKNGGRLTRDQMSQAMEEVRAGFMRNGGFSGPPGGGPPSGFSPGFGDRSRESDRSERGASDRRESDRRESDRREGDRRESDRGSESRSGDSRNSTPKSDPKLPPKKPKVKVTVPIPEEFKAGDANHDGQLAFAEWRRWGDRSVSEFESLDRNRDGFLTPTELQVVAKTKGAPATSKPVSPGAVASPVITSPAKATESSAIKPAGNMVPVTPTPQKSAVSEPVKAPAPLVVTNTTATPLPIAELATADPALVSDAKRQFEILDEDRDGKLSQSEWNAISSRVRRMFDGGGVTIATASTQEEFVGYYVKLKSRP